MTKLVYALVAAVLIAASCASADTTTAPWVGPVTAWYYAPNGPDTNLVLMRQLGTNTDTVDDTQSVTFTPLGANYTIQTHSSPWAALDLSSFGVPADAKVVELGIKTIITKPTTPGATTIYLFVRTFGSGCCSGPTESPNTPVDYSISTNPNHIGEVAQTAQETAPDGQRGYNQITVPVVDGQIEWAWGYRKYAGDAIAFDLYLNGYGT